MSKDVGKDLVTGYVQNALQGISGERQEEIRQEVRKREDKLKGKRLKKRTLTVFRPFHLETSKRIKVEGETSSLPYEPLWQQI